MPVRFVESPEGQELPFIAMKLHSVRGEMVPQRMLYPSEQMLAQAIAALPEGARSDLTSIRARLAAEHGAEATCPVTTRRMVDRIAEAAVTAHAEGAATTPFWRVFDAGRPAARRLAGGAEFIAARQREEG